MNRNNGIIALLNSQRVENKCMLFVLPLILSMPTGGCAFNDNEPFSEEICSLKLEIQRAEHNLESEINNNKHVLSLKQNEKAAILSENNNVRTRIGVYKAYINEYNRKLENLRVKGNYHLTSDYCRIPIE